MTARTPLINLVEPLENLDFSLVEGFLDGSKFVFKVLDCVVLTCLHMFAPIDVPETTTTYQFFSFVLIVDY